jgi:RNA polymerase sigma-70 factor (ECF subfamily)
MNIVKGTFTSKKSNGPIEQIDFNALFKEFYDRLVFFSFQLVKDKDRARDIVQDAFVKYWNLQETVTHDKIAIKNFLYRTVRNASLNSIRHEKVVEGYIQLHDNIEPEEPPVIEAIITAEVMAAIHSAVQSLPERYKVISVMGYMEDKKNQEIADELDMSINTVKKQKQRALQLLKMKLEPEIFVLILALTAGMYLSL